MQKLPIIILISACGYLLFALETTKREYNELLDSTYELLHPPKPEQKVNPNWDIKATMV